MQDIIPGQCYRHYKSQGGVDYTYRVIGIAKHSETDDFLVIYQPLYAASSTWLGAGQYAARPLSMRIEKVLIDGTFVPRFVLIKSDI